MSPVVSGDGSTLYVCNRFDNNISVVNTATATEVTTIPVVREPVAMAITTSSSHLFVANFLPTGAVNPGDFSAVISVIDTSTNNKVADISLPNGSIGTRGICMSSDGNYAYVTHQLSRYQIPRVQLDRGWAFTNAVSVIDVSSRELVNTFLLDEVYRGAGTLWACACTTTGTKKLCVTHAGSHELSIIALPGVHYRLNNLPYTGGFSDEPNDVPNDLGFLSGLRKRISLPGKGPRAIAIIGREAYITEYFSDSISVVNIDTGNVGQILLGPQNPPDLAREGEKLFFDCTISYQNWVSCSSCHIDGRPDALNWVLAPTGDGSRSRSTRSTLYSPMTPPTDIIADLPDAYTEILVGFEGDLFFTNPDAEADANAIHEFMIALEPVPSPYLVNGQLSEAAQSGKLIFQNRCAFCHSGTYYTDMQMHNVGTGETPGEELDTPTLIEVWRTAPYLQDGRAATMEEVLTTYNPSNQHGTTSDLSSQQIDDLAEYVLSISAPLRQFAGDFEPDGDVDGYDLDTLTAAWLSQPGDDNWNAVCDISTPKDNFINFKDYAVFAKDWRAVAE